MKMTAIKKGAPGVDDGFICCVAKCFVLPLSESFDLNSPIQLQEEGENVSHTWLV